MVSRPRSAVLLGALAWVLMVQFFVVEAVAQAAWTPAYSYAAQHISVLGETGCGPAACSPLHGLMNASFIVNGVLIPLGAALVGGSRVFRFSRAATLGLAVFALAGPGTAMVGLWPADVHPPLHAIGAGLFLVAGNLGMILLGFSGWRGPRGRGWSRWATRAALPAGTLGLPATLLWTSGAFLGIGAGGMERAAVYPVVIWPAVRGLAVLAERARSGRSGEVELARADPGEEGGPLGRGGGEDGTGAILGVTDCDQAGGRGDLDAFTTLTVAEPALAPRGRANLDACAALSCAEATLSPDICLRPGHGHSSLMTEAINAMDSLGPRATICK